MLDLLLALVAGIVIGTIAGLVPGIHPNLFAAAVLSITFNIDPLLLSVFLISAGVTNSFLNFIPAILLGAPEGSGSELSVLPGHKLLMKGRGYEAIYLSVIGGLGATIFSLLTLPPFMVIIPAIYTILRPNTHWLLIFVTAYMIFKEGRWKKIIIALLVFLSSGVLGIISLNINSSMIFPLLSGFFGLPLLLVSIRKKTKLPGRITFKMKKLNKKFILKGISIGSLSGIVAGILPGIGSSQSAVLSQEVTGMEKSSDSLHSFLISLGGINTADIIYSLFAIILIGNPRSGIAVAVNELLTVTFNHLLIFLPVVLFSSLIAAFITLKISKIIILNLRKVNYSRISLTVFIFLLILILIMTGSIGLIISLIAMLIGMIPNKTGINRSHCMGSLMLITILYFI